MWKKRLILNLSGGIFEGGAKPEDMMRYKEIGFEGFFTEWKEGKTAEYKKFADGCGMYYQSVHAPFFSAKDMWHDKGEKGETATEELIRCVKEVGSAGVPLIISHAYIGDFNMPGHPTDMGLDRFGRVIKAAEEAGVKIAFENTEGIDYLDAILKTFGGSKAVGFCLDTGHELCYNYGEDLLKKYGDKLIALHINDNLGIRDFGGETTCKDDLHLLPFDGIVDWQRFARRLSECDYQGDLTFELKKVNSTERLENLIYYEMPIDKYLTECYKRACRVAALVLSEENRK